jgi:type IV secretion system protein VirB5
MKLKSPLLKMLTGSIIAGSAVVAGSAGASGLPVIDIANLEQSIQQYIQLTEQLTQLQQQYTQQVRQYESLTGLRNMGQLFDSDADRLMRNYAPSSWQQSLQVLQQGGLPGNAADVVRAAQSFAQQQGIDAKANLVFPANGGDNDSARAYTAATSTAAANAGLSATAYDQSQARMQRVQAYLQQIDNSPDLKASIDLNARLMAEVNESLTQMIQLQAAQMQTISAANAAFLRGKARDTAFTPYAVP